MHLQAPTFLFLLSLSLLTAAAPQLPGAVPASATLAVLDKRSPVFNTITYCQHAHHKGACQTQAVYPNVCYNFSQWWNNRVSSIYVKDRGFCVLYMLPGCKASPLLFTAPGRDELAKWSDKGSSVRCNCARGTPGCFN